MNVMNLIELGKIIADEKRSLEYLWRTSKNLFCSSCGSREFYFMGGKRVRCVQCKRDFWPLQDTKFSLMRIPLPKWLALIKLFELSVSARKAAKEVGISYKSALKAFDILRIAILRGVASDDEILRGEMELDEAYFGGRRKGNRGRGAGGKTIVFGILERGGKASVSIVKDVSAETLTNETVKKVRRGSIVYTDKWRGYDALIFCGYKHLNIDHKRKFKQGKVYINGIEGFWSFAKERLMKHHGISREKFLYYIKEMEWRYNNRDEDLYRLLVEYMIR